ncbi:MAG: 6-carboxytetrahydropterin synthase [Bacteroidota bacterium]|nr:6-carboxytetrahydropterin synthase [Bacteroidota bacterium]
MTRIRITKEFRFEAAHVLKDYDGPCRNIHGHSYELSVTISGIPITDPSSPKKGMVMDFGILKKVVQKEIIDIFDHSLVISPAYGPEILDHMKKNFSNILVVPYQPTSENLLIDFVSRITSHLPENIRLISMKLRETASSYAEWFENDNL